MIKQLKSALFVMSMLTIILGIIYPVFMFTLGKVLFPVRANGSIIYLENTAVGSKLIGQSFQSEKYFHPRPSHANYDAKNSAGSNFGPTSKNLMSELEKNAKEYREKNLLKEDFILSSEIVTSSGSGLDPHISLKDAFLQTKRIAHIRNIDEEIIKKLILKHTEKKTFGFLGEKRVNVLLLNMALDKISRK